MPRAITLVVSLVLLLGLTSGAQAIIYNYTFSGVTPYGTASATMVLDVTGDRLSMTLENTSPTTSGNFPSITSIRLWSDPEITGSVVPNSWSLSRWAAPKWQFVVRFDLTFDPLVVITGWSRDGGLLILYGPISDTAYSIPPLQSHYLPVYTSLSLAMFLHRLI